MSDTRDSNHYGSKAINYETEEEGILFSHAAGSCTQSPNRDDLIVVFFVFLHLPRMAQSNGVGQEGMKDE